MTVRSEAQSIQKGVRCTYMFNTRNERDNLERSCFEFIVVLFFLTEAESRSLTETEPEVEPVGH